MPWITHARLLHILISQIVVGLVTFLVFGLKVDGVTAAGAQLASLTGMVCGMWLNAKGM